MVEDKNIRSARIMGRFINIAVPEAPKHKSDIGPYPAYTINHITPAHPSKQRAKHHKREHEQQHNQKYGETVDTE
jgi:hypothetical protein